MSVGGENKTIRKVLRRSNKLKCHHLLLWQQSQVLRLLRRIINALNSPFQLWMKN